MNAFANIVYELDFVGPKPKFNHKGKERFSSFCGSLVTISAIIITVLACRENLLHCIYSTNPKKVSRIIKQQLSSTKLKSNFTFAFSIKLPNVREQPDSPFFIRHAKDQNAIDKIRDGDDSPTNYETLQLRKCDSSVIKKFYNSSADISDSYFFYCLPEGFADKEIPLKSEYISELMELYLNRQSFESLFELDKTLDRVKIEYYYKEYYSGEQSELSLKRDTIHLFKNSIVKLNFLLQYSSLYTIGNSFIYQREENLQNELFSVIDKNPEIMSFGGMSTVDKKESLDKYSIFPFSIAFSYTWFKANYIIIYVSVDDIVSQLGGTIQIIFPVLSAVYSFFAEYFLRVSMMNSVFCFHYYKDDLNPNKKIKNDELRRKHIIDFDIAFSTINNRYNSNQKNEIELKETVTKLNKCGTMLKYNNTCYLNDEDLEDDQDNQYNQSTKALQIYRTKTGMKMSSLNKISNLKGSVFTIIEEKLEHKEKDKLASGAYESLVEGSKERVNKIIKTSEEAFDLNPSDPLLLETSPSIIDTKRNSRQPYYKEESLIPETRPKKISFFNFNKEKKIKKELVERFITLGELDNENEFPMVTQQAFQGQDKKNKVKSGRTIEENANEITDINDKEKGINDEGEQTDDNNSDDNNDYRNSEDNMFREDSNDTLIQQYIKEEKTVFNNFFKIIKKRQDYKIRCWDYFKSNFKQNCCGKFLCPPLTLKQKIVLTCDEMLQRKMNYESYMKMNYDMQLIKNMIIQKDLVEIACIPSLNLYSQDSIDFINLGFNSSTKFWKTGESLVKVLDSNFSTERADRKVWENYLSSCF